VLTLSISLVSSTSECMLDAPSGVPRIVYDLSHLLSSLSGFAGRWQTILMIPSAFCSFRPLAHLSSEDFPLFFGWEVLFLWEDLFEERSPWEALALLAAPGLLYLSDTISRILHLPWAQLTHVSITSTYAWPRPFRMQDVIKSIATSRSYNYCSPTYGI